MSESSEILFVHSGKWSFIQIDRAALAKRWRVRDWFQPGKIPNVFGLIPAVLRADIVVGWFASWHTFVPITLAWLFRKPSVLIIGGFDTANMPEIGYGYQQGGFRRWAARWTMKRAGRLVTNSHYSREEFARNTGLDPGRVTVVHHGIPDSFGELGEESRRERIALTVGHLARQTLEQKGHRPFVDAAKLLPDVRFVFIGRWLDDAIDVLRESAPENVLFTGPVSDQERDDWYARSSVYVQASWHEGFGMAVAEAMLAGCVPVVVETTAMPEVVGDCGVMIAAPRAEDVAEGVDKALDLAPSLRRAARERVLNEFPVAMRERELVAVIEEELGRK